MSDNNPTPTMVSQPGSGLPPVHRFFQLLFDVQDVDGIRDWIHWILDSRQTTDPNLTVLNDLAERILIPGLDADTDGGRFAKYGPYVTYKGQLCKIQYMFGEVQIIAADVFNGLGLFMMLAINPQSEEQCYLMLLLYAAWCTIIGDTFEALAPRVVNIYWLQQNGTVRVLLSSDELPVVALGSSLPPTGDASLLAPDVKKIYKWKNEVVRQRAALLTKVLSEERVARAGQVAATRAFSSESRTPRQPGHCAESLAFVLMSLLLARHADDSHGGDVWDSITMRVLSFKPDLVSAVVDNLRVEGASAWLGANGRGPVDFFSQFKDVSTAMCPLCRALVGEMCDKWKKTPMLIDMGANDGWQQSVKTRSSRS